MRRLPLLAAAVVVLAAGCGGSHAHRATTAVTTTAPTTTSAAPTTTTTAGRPAHRLRDVRVTVVDAQLDRRIAGARVRIGRRSALTNRHGVARIPLARRAALVTVASKAGYDSRSLRISYRRFPQAAIRIYRRDLQWPLYGATPSRAQDDPYLHVRPPFRVVWSRGLDTLIEFPAVVSDGAAYIVNARGTVFALDERTGALLWRHQIPHGESAASPAVYGDELIVHGMDGHVWVLRRSDGRLLWHVTVGSPVESSPIVVDGADVFGDWAGELTALDLRTHRVRWRRYDGCKITSSASLSGGTIFIGDYCGRLLALDARTGALRWSRAVNGRIYGTPAVAGGRVFVPSSDGDSLTAFTTGGSELWRRDTGSYVYSSPAVADGGVYFGAYNGVFYGLDARSGATRFEVGTGGPISGAAVVVDHVAYAGSFAHRIVGVSTRTGRELVDFPHGEYVPVSGSGTMLLLHGYSRLYGVEERP